MKKNTKQKHHLFYCNILTHAMTKYYKITNVQNNPNNTLNNLNLQKKGPELKNHE